MLFSRRSSLPDEVAEAQLMACNGALQELELELAYQTGQFQHAVERLRSCIDQIASDVGGELPGYVLLANALVSWAQTADAEAALRTHFLLTPDFQINPSRDTPSFIRLVRGWNPFPKGTDVADAFRDDSTRRSYSGIRSTWCVSADMGDTQYVPDTEVWFIYVPFAFRDAHEGCAGFNFWLDKEPDFDLLARAFSTYGASFSSPSMTGKPGRWIEQEVSLANVDEQSIFVVQASVRLLPG